MSTAAIVGLWTTERVVGNGDIVESDVRHPNGNYYDQVLVTGPALTITARPGRVTRASFVDPSDNIVQVEFSGTGTLTLVLENASGPAQPLNYSQNVRYMKGRAEIVITGADETTNVSVFSVGRATAFDPTGTYNILQPPGDTNRPDENGSPLFAGHSATSYDGTAQIAFIAISDLGGGKFGGVRTANVRYRASHGFTGIYAPNVTFFGPVYIGDIDASGEATPVLMVGSALSDARITGGSLAQDNGRAIEVNRLFPLQFTAGTDSTGKVLPAQTNLATFKQLGVDVTDWMISK